MTTSMDSVESKVLFAQFNGRPTSGVRVYGLRIHGPWEMREEALFLSVVKENRSTDLEYLKNLSYYSFILG